MFDSKHESDAEREPSPTCRPLGGADAAPLVSIAIPVYNGEAYLAEAISSVLEQTFEDFELILCDNASTDATAEICHDFRRQDKRIRYHRNAENLGAARNFNLGVSLAQGLLFKWLAADESIKPTFLAQAVPVLDSDPSVALVCSHYEGRNEFRGVVRELDYDHHLTEASTSARLRRLLLRTVKPVLPIWGLMRTDELRGTHRIRGFVGSDHCLVVELVLNGKFHQLPSPLLCLRSHPAAFHAMKRRSAGLEGRREAEWFDPSRRHRVVMPHWRRLIDHTRAVAVCPEPLGARLTMLTTVIVPYAIRNAKLLGKDLVFGVGLGRAYDRLRRLNRKAERALIEPAAPPTQASEP